MQQNCKHEAFKPTLKKVRPILVALCFFFMVAGQGHAETEYLSREAFLSQYLSEKQVQPRVLWLTPDIRAALDEQGWYIKGARIRYWQAGAKTAWILDEIGKEKPITIGVVVEDGKIQALRILTFRESRGWEVRHDFFTDQFQGARLQKKKLDRHIDNITGATLSVRAVSKVARVALLLHALAQGN